MTRVRCCIDSPPCCLCINVFTLLRRWHRYQIAVKEKETESEEKGEKLKSKDKEDLTIDGEDLDKNKGLTEEEVAEVKNLMQEGFQHWSKRDFLAFKNSAERNGRKAYEDISRDLEDKTPEEVSRYSDVFWRLGPSRLNNWDNIEKQIERGEPEFVMRHRCCCAS